MAALSRYIYIFLLFVIIPYFRWYVNVFYSFNFVTQYSISIHMKFVSTMGWTETSDPPESELPDQENVKTDGASRVYGLSVFCFWAQAVLDGRVRVWRINPFVTEPGQQTLHNAFELLFDRIITFQFQFSYSINILLLKLCPFTASFVPP